MNVDSLEIKPDVSNGCVSMGLPKNVDNKFMSKKAMTVWASNPLGRIATRLRSNGTSS